MAQPGMTGIQKRPSVTRTCGSHREESAGEKERVRNLRMKEKRGGEGADGGPDVGAFQLPALTGASEDHTDVWFNFIARCCLFEALTYHMVTLEMAFNTSYAADTPAGPSAASSSL